MQLFRSLLSLLFFAKWLRRAAQGKDMVLALRFHAMADSEAKRPVPRGHTPLLTPGPSTSLLISRQQVGHWQQIIVQTNLFLAADQPDSTLNLDD